MPSPDNNAIYHKKRLWEVFSQPFLIFWLGARQKIEPEIAEKADVAQYFTINA